VGHVAELDGIRAIAVLIVVLAHAGLERVVPGGFGVTLFFFLSGYLITSQLRVEAARAGTIDIRNFYLRRICRINPPLWITIGAATLLAGTGLIQFSVQWHVIIAQMFFYVNYVAPPDQVNGAPITPLWSLAVEEHFYLVFPFIFQIALRRMAGRHAALFMLGLCFAVLAIRVANVALLTDYTANYYMSHTRIDSILFGCCLAMWNNPVLDRQTCTRPAAFHVALALLTLGICLLIRSEMFRQTFRYTLQGAALFILFAAVLQGNTMVGTVLRWRALRAIGAVSYSVYLCHETIFMLLDQQAAGLPAAARDAVAVVLIAAYATLMFWLVDRPLAMARQRFGRSDGAARLSFCSDPAPRGGVGCKQPTLGRAGNLDDARRPGTPR